MANNIRLLTKTEYTSLSNDESKVKELEQVTKKIFSYRVVDLLKTDQEIISYFLKEKHEFGAGYGEITGGLADIESFSTSPDLRFPAERKLLKDYVATVDTLNQNIITLTYNNATLKQYFKDFESYNDWIRLNFKRIRDTLNLGIFLFLKKIFYIKKSNYDSYVALKTINTETWPIIKAADDIIKTLKTMKKVESSTDKSSDLFKKIIETYNKMIAEPSDQWHIKQSVKGFPVSVEPENMVLIGSLEDKLEFEQSELITYYNPNFFKLPDIKTFWLDLPKGRAFLLDKRALQISPYFEGTYTTFFPKTLDTDIYHHFQVRVGLFDLYPGVMFVNKTTKSAGDE